MKTALFNIMLLICSANLYAEDGHNLLDSLGQRHGWWADTSEGIVEYCMYREGVRNGLYHSHYIGSMIMKEIGEYEQGIQVGIWYYFDEIGYLVRKGYNIDDTTFLEIPLKLKPDKNGKINQFDSNKRRHGLWKFYDGLDVYHYFHGKLEGPHIEYCVGFYCEFTVFNNHKMSDIRYYTSNFDYGYTKQEIIYFDYEKPVSGVLRHFDDVKGKALSQSFYTTGELKDKGVTLISVDFNDSRYSMINKYGDKAMEYLFYEELLDGEWKFYDKNGMLIKREFFDHYNSLKEIEYTR